MKITGAESPREKGYHEGFLYGYDEGRRAGFAEGVKAGERKCIDALNQVIRGGEDFEVEE